MIYTSTAFVLFFLSLVLWDLKRVSPIIRPSNQEKRILIVMVLWLVFFEGLRWKIGTDWDNYYNAFVVNDDMHMGWAYRTLIDVFKKISQSYTLFLVLLAVITYTSVSSLYLKYSPNALMSLCIFFCGHMGIMGCNRQLLAMSICIMTVPLIIKRKLIPFLLVGSLATIFHITAALFLPAYYLYTLKYNERILVLLLIIAFIAGVFQLINRIPFIEYLAVVDRMSETELQSYVLNDGTQVSGVSIAGSFKRSLFFLLALSARKRVKTKEYDFFVLLYWVGCIIFLLFNGSYIQIMAGRGASYYNQFENVVIPFALLSLPAKTMDKKIVWFIFFLFYFYLMWRDMNSYYITVGFDIYSPYKNVLF